MDDVIKAMIEKMSKHPRAAMLIKDSPKDNSLLIVLNIHFSKYKLSDERRYQVFSVLFGHPIDSTKELRVGEALAYLAMSSSKASKYLDDLIEKIANETAPTIL